MGMSGLGGCLKYKLCLLGQISNILTLNRLGFLVYLNGWVWGGTFGTLFLFDRYFTYIRARVMKFHTLVVR